MENLGSGPIERGPSPFRNPLLSAKDLSKLPASERLLLIESTATDAMEALTAAGYVEYDSLERMTNDLIESDFIVRRENPEALLRALNDGSLHIDFPDETRYSNAVEWDSHSSSSSMDNAFLEGYGTANGVIAVTGMRRTQLDVTRLEDASQKFYGLDRRFVVSVKGDVPATDIVFVMLRVPIQAFPQHAMSEAEEDRFETWKENQERGINKPSYIFRCYLRPEAARSKTLH